MRCPALAGAASLLVFLAVPPLAALDLNGFLPRRGEGTVALSYTSESWEEFWVGTARTREPEVGAVDITSCSLWGRYGLTDRLALVANLPHVDADSDGPAGFGQSSFQDLSVLVQAKVAERTRGPFTQRWVVAAGARLPVGDYEADLPIDVGDGTADLLLRLVWQRVQGRFYVSQQLGVDLRSEDAPDQFPLYTEAGVITGRWTWSGFFQWLLAAGGSDIGDPGFTFPGNREELQRIGARVFARVNDQIGISFGGFTTLDGRNTSDTTAVFVGGVFDFDLER
jgi:hypothetical protein